MNKIRAEFRAEFGLAEDDLLLVQIGSGFKTKGVDRSLKALAALPSRLKKRTRLFVIGQDDPKVFQLQSAALGLGDQVQFFKGRNDIPRFLLGADLLIHPAYNEAAGMVLVEAVVMAATLAQIKSRILLPVHAEDEDEEDPRQQIVRGDQANPAGTTCNQNGFLHFFTKILFIVV